MSNNTIKITATVPAWLPHWNSVDDVLALVRDEKNVQIINALSFVGHAMDRGDKPYTRMGEATITVTLLPREELTTIQIGLLKKQLETERAESMQRQNEILNRISKLSALTMTVEAE